MNKKELAKELKNAGTVKRGSFTLKSGKEAAFYVDLKGVFGNPHIIDELANHIAEEIDEKTTCIAVAGYGGAGLSDPNKMT